MFANFQLYPLVKAKERLQAYYPLYGTLNGIFIVFLILIGLTTNRLFRIMKQI